MLSKRSAYSGGNGYHLLAKNDRVAFEASGTTDPDSWTHDPLPENIWSHVVIVFDLNSTNLSTYINGVLDSVSTGLLSPNNVSPDLFFGKDDLGNQYHFNGKLDDIGIWNRALTECEITELYTGQDCNVGITELNSNQPKELIKIVNLLGQEVEYTPNTVLIYQYSDGTSEKVFTIED